MIICALAASCIATAYQWRYKSTLGPLVNPLKGWVPYVSDGTAVHQPYSTVYYNVSWRELEPERGLFKFAEWEHRCWDLAAATGKHVVFRVNVDYPSQPSGVPNWLLAEGVQTTRYSDYGGGQSPDYHDPRFQTALLRFVKALGARYDSNPRVAFVQVGLLGFWGEWHTWPRTELFAPEPFQRQVLDAMTTAFPNKKLMARNPSGVAGSYRNLGFHDDMIPQDTLGKEDWKFLPGILANGLGQNWAQFPRGGEMVPFAASQYMGRAFGETMKAVRDVHLSWIGPYCPALEQSSSHEFNSNCATLIRAIGYQFSLTHVNVSFSGGKCRFELRGTNSGVAPFYYPWPVRFALINSKGVVVSQPETGIDIRTWQPGDFYSKGEVLVGTSPGSYRLALGVIDPYLRKPDIEFASDLQRVGGWQVLGSVRIDR